jgi:FkbM family methyltransferase
MNIIQIGCNDCNDDVFKFVSLNRDKISKFLVIDALPDCVTIAKEKYSFLGERLYPVNCGVGAKTGIMQFYYPSGDKLSAHASLLESHLHSHSHQSLDYLCVPVLSINDVLSFFDQVDRLYIDAEGLDVSTLLTLDYFKFKPNYIEYESAHADGTGTRSENYFKLKKLLMSFGYEIKRNGEYNSVAELSPNDQGQPLSFKERLI